MPDVDLAAIRADVDGSVLRPGGPSFADAMAAAHRLGGYVVPLLALVDEQATAIDKIREEIAASNEDLCRSRDLLGKTQAMVERGYDRVVAERDELATAVGRRDARITRLQLALIAARQEAACYRADHRDRHGLPSDPRHAGCRAADGTALETPGPREASVDAESPQGPQTATQGPSRGHSDLPAGAAIP